MTLGSGGTVGITAVGVGVAGKDTIGVGLGEPGVGVATRVGAAVGATVGAAAVACACVGVAGAAVGAAVVACACVGVAGAAVGLAVPPLPGPVVCDGVAADGDPATDWLATGLADGAPLTLSLTSFVALKAASARPMASAGPSTR